MHSDFVDSVHACHYTVVTGAEPLRYGGLSSTGCDNPQERCKGNPPKVWMTGRDRRHLSICDEQMDRLSEHSDSLGTQQALSELEKVK
jgi:hypothetical protein